MTATTGNLKARSSGTDGMVSETECKDGRLVYTTQNSIPIRLSAVMRSVAVYREQWILSVGRRHHCCNWKCCCPLPCYSDRTLTGTKTVPCPRYADTRPYLRYYYHRNLAPSPPPANLPHANAAMQKALSGGRKFERNRKTSYPKTFILLNFNPQ
jgi:hypothetical protein